MRGFKLAVSNVLIIKFRVFLPLLKIPEGVSAELLRIAHGEDLAVHVDKHLRGQLAGGTFSLEARVPVLAQDTFQCWLVVSLIDKS